MSHGHHSTTPHVAEKPDAWHTHTSDEPAPQAAHAENIHGPTVMLYGIAIMVFIAVFVIATVVYFNWYTNRLEIAIQERLDLTEGAPPIQAEYNRIRSEIEAQQASFGWANAEKGLIRIPLEKAMERVVTDYQSRQGGAAAGSAR
jgi:flagellar basal body-associated protein FliL